MGAGLCTLRHPTLDQDSKSHGARDERSRDGTESSFKEVVKLKCWKGKNRRRVGRMKETEEEPEKKIVTIGDWMTGPDNHKRGESSGYAFMQSKKKVHPWLNQNQHHRSSISEAKDSLCLDRLMNHHHHHHEEMSECSTAIIRSLSGKSQKRVSFKLAHDVILYSPDEPHCKEASSEEETCCSEDSFSSPVGPNGRVHSLDSTEEPIVRLAVDILCPGIPRTMTS